MTFQVEENIPRPFSCQPISGSSVQVFQKAGHCKPCSFSEPQWLSHISRGFGDAPRAPEMYEMRLKRLAEAAGALDKPGRHG